MKWFYAQGQQQIGPVEDQEFERLIGIGVIRPETLVWSEGMANWQNLASVRKPAAPPPTPAAVIPEPAQAPSPQPQYAQPSAQASQPMWQPAAPIYGSPMPGVRYGGFWIRFLARVLDGVILFVAGLILRLPFGLALGLGPGFGRGRFGPGMFGPAMFGMFGASILLNIAIGVAYEAFFVSTRGATPGKMALGLKIIQANGAPVPVGLAVGRYFAQWISGAILMIGYIIAGFDSEKRALHDHICGTRVIHTGN